MKAYIFSGQGAQYPSMGKELYDSSATARKMFNNANGILGYNITDVMFNGTDEDLKQTKITQPAIYIYSVILSVVKKDDFTPGMVAGHSLGEFSALAAVDSVSFEDGLLIVKKRAELMQKACEATPSTMAAVVGFDIARLESILKSIKDEYVIPANFNSPQQVVISGTVQGVKTASELIKAEGGRVIILPVSGAFHSQLMEPAKEGLSEIIMKTTFKQPKCPVYQNVNGQPVKNVDIIKSNLVMQLTTPVRWTQTIQNMISDGAKSFVEVGPGKVLQGLVKKIKGDAIVSSL